MNNPIREVIMLTIHTHNHEKRMLREYELSIGQTKAEIILSEENLAQLQGIAKDISGYNLRVTENMQGRFALFGKIGEKEEELTIPVRSGNTLRDFLFLSAAAPFICAAIEEIRQLRNELKERDETECRDETD